MVDKITDPRRQQPIAVEWVAPKVAHVSIGNTHWNEVEWSEERQAWCIQDAAGRCLHHHSRVHGQLDDKEGAILLAQEMIHNGRLPTPEEANQAEQERVSIAREKRRRQPAQIRRRQEQERRDSLLSEHLSLEWEEKKHEPYWALIADVFDLADPDLWKRNSFARLRDKLILSLKAEIAGTEHDILKYSKGRNPPAKTTDRLERAKALLALIENQNNG